MAIVSIRHLTTYRYRKPVAFGEHRMMFRPLQAFDQRLISAEVTVSPDPELLRHIQDVSGACVGVARFDAPSDRLVFDSRVRIENSACGVRISVTGGLPAALTPGLGMVTASGCAG